MLYRAVAPNLVFTIGYAASWDGLDWLRLDRSVLKPEGEFETKGVEDPRITPHRRHLLYDLYRLLGDRMRVSLAASSSLIAWEGSGWASSYADEDNKDAVLFPEKIGGRYVLLHHRPRRLDRLFR